MGYIVLLTIFLISMVYALSEFVHEIVEYNRFMRKRIKELNL